MESGFFADEAGEEFLSHLLREVTASNQKGGWSVSHDASSVAVAADVEEKNLETISNKEKEPIVVNPGSCGCRDPQILGWGS